MRVALSGYYGFGNHGDEALLSGLIAALQSRGHVPVALSAAPEETRRLHEVEARSRTFGLVPALLSVDAVISGGGGLLQDATSARSLTYYLAVMRLARAMGKRTVVFGQSVGPLSARGRARVHRALQGVPVSVRDRPSVELLASLGVSCHRGADAALLAPAARPTGRTLPDDAPTVLVPRAGHAAHTALLTDIARRLADAGHRVEAVAFHPRQDEADAAAVQRGAGGGPPTVPADFHEAFARVAAARFVLSARLHALVFAAAAGAPHAGLVYDPKVDGFLESSGGAAFHPPFAADEVLRALRTPAEGMGDARKRLLSTAHAAVDWLDDALRTRTPG